jgi:hypothetical protein
LAQEPSTQLLFLRHASAAAVSTSPAANLLRVHLDKLPELPPPIKLLLQKIAPHAQQPLSFNLASCSELLSDDEFAANLQTLEHRSLSPELLFRMLATFLALTPSSLFSHPAQIVLVHILISTPDSHRPGLFCDLFATFDPCSVQLLQLLLLIMADCFSYSRQATPVLLDFFLPLLCRPSLGSPILPDTQILRGALQEILPVPIAQLFAPSDALGFASSSPDLIFLVRRGCSGQAELFGLDNPHAVADQQPLAAVNWIIVNQPRLKELAETLPPPRRRRQSGPPPSPLKVQL